MPKQAQASSSTRSEPSRTVSGTASSKLSAHTIRTDTLVLQPQVGRVRLKLPWEPSNWAAAARDLVARSPAYMWLPEGIYVAESFFSRGAGLQRRVPIWRGAAAGEHAGEARKCLLQTSGRIPVRGFPAEGEWS